jgi:glucokinase
VLGIDVGGTNIRAGLYAPSLGLLRHIHAAPTEASRGGSYALSRVTDVARAAVAQGRAAAWDVSKVGIGVPELVGLEGEIESACSLPWKSPRVRASLREFGEVTIESDVRAAATAEARVGAGRKYPTFLYVCVGTGISCTLIIDGKPFLGHHGHAISFASGPTVEALDPDAKTRYEALEARVSGPALARRARQLGLVEADAIALCRSAAAGPGPARDLVDRAATELALHVAILGNALDPPLILLGGGLGGSRGPYWETFQVAMRRFLWGTYSSRIRLRRAQLGTTVGMMGAALCAIESQRE